MLSSDEEPTTGLRASPMVEFAAIFVFRNSRSRDARGEGRIPVIVLDYCDREEPVED